MKWPKWNYSIPPKTKSEGIRMALTFGAFYLLGLYFPWQLAVTACAIMSSLTIFSIWLSWSTARSNDKLNAAILDSIGAIRDCYRMLSTAEYNLHIAMGQLAKLGYTFERQQLPVEPKEDAPKLRKHLARALAELDKHGIDFKLLDGEIEFAKEPAE